MRNCTVLMILSVLWVTPSHAGTLSFAEFTFDFGGFAPVTIEATNASGTSLSDSLFQIGAGTRFNGAVTPLGTIPGWIVPIGLHQHVFETLASPGIFSGLTAGAVTGQVPFRADLGLGTAFPRFTVGVATTQTPTVNSFPVVFEMGPWRVGTAQITGVTTFTPGGGLVTGVTLKRSGTNRLASTGQGAVVVVSPIRVTWPPNPLNHQRMNVQAGFATLTLQFVPEPSTALLLGSGALVFAAFGRTRRGRRH